MVKTDFMPGHYLKDAVQISNSLNNSHLGALCCVSHQLNICRSRHLLVSRSPRSKTWLKAPLGTMHIRSLESNPQQQLPDNNYWVFLKAVKSQG